MQRSTDKHLGNDVFDLSLPMQSELSSLRWSLRVRGMNVLYVMPCCSDDR
jgi:hypothetical protein